MHGESAYGLWTLVILNSAIFIFFAFSFTSRKPKLTGEALALSRRLLLPYLPRCMAFH
tara:strand:+ start:11263 stop:11436 length:174 start_codon:yes stop_codon:yes gene_type:complete